MTPHDLLVVEADRMLARLVRFCHLGQAHGVAPTARLAPDMFDLAEQITIAARFPLRGAYPLAGLPLPPDAPEDHTWDGLRRTVERDRRALAEITPERIAAAAVTRVRFEAGQTMLDLGVEEFVHRLIVPNMQFHTAMAYAILRAQGVPLGKGDFDGLHVYAAGFSFV